MFISLRQRLNNLIKARGYIPYPEIKEMCESGAMGRTYKISNAERRLRKSESPDVEADIGEKGYIKGYRFCGKPAEYDYFKVVGTDKVIKIIK
jgi:hypothetical protein